MSEMKVIEHTPTPITKKRIIEEIIRLGVRKGDILLVHSSLSSLGWVCGGPQAVVQAILELVGQEGTVAMPAHSGDWSDPSEWAHPPVPREWIETIYQEWPAFEPAVTPTRGMGRIAELFRTFPGTLRSHHPQVSFCANGKHSSRIVSDHPLTPQFGMASPLGQLYHLNAKILLLGVGYDSCTSLHLAETFIKGMPTKKMGTAIIQDGVRVWKWFEDFAYDSDDFETIGAAIDMMPFVQIGKVGNAECRLIDLREAVDFAIKWMSQFRFPT